MIPNQLHTHYHRYQCIGSPELKAKGAKIAVGESEAPLLDRVEISAPLKIPDSFLLNGELPDLGRRLTPFQRPGVDKKLSDGEGFNWGQYKITKVSHVGKY